MSDNILKHGLTRRQFLKSAAVTTTVAAMGDRLFGGQSPHWSRARSGARH